MSDRRSKVIMFLSCTSPHCSTVFSPLLPLVDPHVMDVVRVRMEDLTHAQFKIALASGVPVQIMGVDHRLQGQWTPKAFTDILTNTPVTCINCNTQKELDTTMSAEAFFGLLSSSAGNEEIYKVKVGNV